MESDQRRYELCEEVRDFLAPHGFLEPEQITEVISIVVKHLNDWLRDTDNAIGEHIEGDMDPRIFEMYGGQQVGLQLAQAMANELAKAPARRIRKVLNAH